MATPVWNQQVVAQGLARLTGIFGTSLNIRAWLAAYLGQLQAIEDATQGVLSLRFLASAQTFALPATNVVFDTIGALVGQPRSGLSDADYRVLIYLRIAVNRSSGRTTDWSNFAAILLRAGASPPVEFYELGAGLFLGIWNIPEGPPPLLKLDPNVIGKTLGGAVPNGVYGLFGYTIWPDGNDFEWADINNLSTTGQGTFGDSVAGVVGGLLISGVGMNT